MAVSECKINTYYPNPKFGKHWPQICSKIYKSGLWDELTKLLTIIIWNTNDKDNSYRQEEALKDTIATGEHPRSELLKAKSGRFLMFFFLGEDYFSLMYLNLIEISKPN